VERYPGDQSLVGLSHQPPGATRNERAQLGRIINIASVHGLVASKEKSAYVAAKHAVVGLTKVIALENAQTNITCNALCPGWVLTPLVQQQIDQRMPPGSHPTWLAIHCLAKAALR
jgi:NAD(P)-dependent dehydrogenase (short-subunit alcohol dehydrogenase family)